MKYTILSVAAILGISLLLVGCGKSEVSKKLETELNGQVMKMHDEQMTAVEGMNALVKDIDAAIANNDELREKVCQEDG